MTKKKTKVKEWIVQDNNNACARLFGPYEVETAEMALEEYLFTEQISIEDQPDKYWVFLLQDAVHLEVSFPKQPSISIKRI